jgi:alanyl-tRNA synthetase
MAYRVVADHIRMLTITLSDKGRPDKIGQGYVIRHILRRAILYSTTKLNGKPGLLSSLVPVVIEILGDVFPELKEDAKNVCNIIDREEKKFLKTLIKGEKLFNESIKTLSENEKCFPGHIAWRLSDTFGFPIDLTQLMAEEHGLKVNLDEYEALRNEASVGLSSYFIRHLLYRLVHLLVRNSVQLKYRIVIINVNLLLS